MIRVSVWLACIPLTESVEEYFYYLSFHLLKKHLFISTYSIYSVNERYLNYKNESVISYVILKTYLVDRKRRKVKSKFQLSLHIRAPNPTRISWVQFSSSVVSDSLRPHGPQHVKPLCPSPTPRVHSNSCPSSQWYHPTISSSVIPFSSAFNLSQHQGLFKWVSSLYQVAKVLEFQLQHQSFKWIFRINFPKDGLVWSPRSPRDSQ